MTHHSNAAAWHMAVKLATNYWSCHSFLHVSTHCHPKSSNSVSRAVATLQYARTPLPRPPILVNSCSSSQRQLSHHHLSSAFSTSSPQATLPPSLVSPQYSALPIMPLPQLHCHRFYPLSIALLIFAARNQDITALNVC
jgi:hypothetical protein